MNWVTRASILFGALLLGSFSSVGAHALPIAVDYQIQMGSGPGAFSFSFVHAADHGTGDGFYACCDTYFEVSGTLHALFDEDFGVLTVLPSQLTLTGIHQYDGAFAVLELTGGSLRDHHGFARGKFFYTLTHEGDSYSGTFHFASEEHVAGVDGPNTISVDHLTLWGQNFKQGHPPCHGTECDTFERLGIDLQGVAMSSVPEPGAFSLLAFAGLLGLARAGRAA